MPIPSRLIRLSGALYWLSTALLPALPLTVVLAVVLGLTDAASLASRFPDLPPATVLTPGKATAVAALGCLALVPMLAMLWQMRGLFGRYRRGEILTDACASHILRIGQALIVLALAALLIPTLQLLVLTLDNPEGEKILSFSIEGGMIGLLLAGGLLLTIGWVMREATREIESFV